MDNIQNEVNDYTNPINEKIKKIVDERAKKIVKKKYPMGYSNEQYSEICEELRPVVRQEILDEMKFEQQYKQQRHIGDIEEEERKLDAQNSSIKESQMNDEWWLKKEQYRAEGQIVNDDINGISPNSVVDRYSLIADFFNIEDTIALQKVMVSAKDGNIDLATFRGLISDENSNKMIEAIVQQNNGQVNIEQLTNQISQAMQNLVEQRVETSKGYMQVAKEDLNARAFGVERKIDALNKAKENSLADENTYSKAMNELNSRKQSIISIGDIECATSNVRASSINEETSFIKQAIREERTIETDNNKEKE